MKKALLLLAVVLLALSLSACACFHKEKKKPIHVKCPACGYEFTVPAPPP